MNVLSRNRMGVVPGAPYFDVHSNCCDYFSIGKKDGADVWIEGEIINGANGAEFIFNGRLFCRKGGQATIIDGFPKTNAPDGWSKRQALDGSGYALLDSDKEVVFEYRIRDGKVCEVTLGLHKADGNAAAVAGQGGLLLAVSPAMIGRNGIVFG